MQHGILIDLFELKLGIDWDKDLHPHKTNHTPQCKENGDLNAGGQLSLPVANQLATQCGSLATMRQLFK